MNPIHHRSGWNGSSPSKPAHHAASEENGVVEDTQEHGDGPDGIQGEKAGA